LFGGLWGEESMGKEVALRIDCRRDISMRNLESELRATITNAISRDDGNAANRRTIEGGLI